MQYFTIVNSLWRGKRELQILNVCANAAAMTLVYTLLEVLMIQKASADSSSPRGILIICMLCAMTVAKVVSDHMFTAQWTLLMRLRAIGASPVRLICAVVDIQIFLSCFSGLAGSCLGLLLKTPINIVYAGLDMSIPAFDVRVVIAAMMLTIVLSLVCGCLGAGISALRVVFVAPDVVGSKTSSAKKHNIWFTLLLLGLAIAGTIYIAQGSYSDIKVFYGVGLCIVAAWSLIRLAPSMLGSISRFASLKYSNRPIMLLAFRDIGHAHSTALFTLVAIASVLSGTVYGLYGYQDINARTSLHNMFDNRVLMVQSIDSHTSNADFMQKISSRDSSALVLARTRVVPKNDDETCGEQLGQYGAQRNARVATMGSLQSLFPSRSVSSGDKTLHHGVVSVAGNTDDSGNRVRIGQIMCVSQGKKVSEQPITAIVSIPSALAEYFVAQGASDAELGSLAIVTHHNEALSGSSSLNVEPAKEWINNLPPGKAESCTGGNGLEEAAPIVYPVLFICFLGAVSVVFDIVEEKKRESRSAWLIDFGKWRFALSGTLTVLSESLLAGFAASLFSLFIVNMTLNTEKQIINDGIRGYVPVGVLILLLIAILCVSLVAFLAHLALYERNLKR